MAGARAEAGRALRRTVPRSGHAAWDPSGRPSPLLLLEESNRRRLPDLVPIRDAAARWSVSAASAPLLCRAAAGDRHDDPLLLQVKQAAASVLEPHAGRSRYRHPGHRAVGSFAEAYADQTEADWAAFSHARGSAPGDGGRGAGTNQRKGAEG